MTVGKALTIAGSDCGGGAGIQADLKTFAALGVYGSSVITSITAQNTRGVQDVGGVSPALVGKQLDSVLEDIGADAVKTGMLYDAGIIEVVAARLSSHRVPYLVVDPVMVASSGARLLTPEGEVALRDKLLPLADIITPNEQEASVLWGRPIETDRDVWAAAQALRDLGPDFVIITGIRRGRRCVDACWDGTEFYLVEGPFIDTPHTHGTGCTFSAALTACLARGASARQAVTMAKDYVLAGLRYAYRVGHGTGPLNHLAPFYPGNLDDPVILTTRVKAFEDWTDKPVLGPWPLLNVIIGGPLCRGKDYAELTRIAVEGGARLIQLREKDWDTCRMVAVAREMREVCHAYGALLVVNDRADVAAAAGADGVHIGQKDLTPRMARALIGPGKIIGVSVDNLAQAQEAVTDGADYVGLGPVYATTSKDCEVPPCGPAVVAEVAAGIPVPVIAIGGVTPDNTLPLLRAGARGVAVISVVWDAPEPRREVERFMNIFKSYSEFAEGGN